MIRGVTHLQHANHPAHILRRKRHSYDTVIALAVLLVLGGLFIAVTDVGGVNWKILLLALAASTYRLLVAYAIALLLATIIALLVGNGRVSDFLFPVFDVLQNVPSFALIPLFIYFFGFTNLMVIIFAASSIIWPILFAALGSMRAAHTDLSDAATIFGARGIKRTLFYLAPLSFPAILTGSIVGIAIGWEAVIGAEIIGGAGGFGAFITAASQTGISPGVVAGTLAIITLVFVMNRMIWSPLLSESTHYYV